MDHNALTVYLIGRPQSGKTTVFHALGGDQGAGHRRVAKVPDPRLDRLAELFQPKQQVHAEILFCDIFAERAGAPQSRAADRFTTALGEADMLAVVVRCFGGTEADGSPLDSARSLDAVLLELVVADHSLVERRLERVESDLKKGLKEHQEEHDVLQRCLAHLAQEQPLTGLDLEENALRLLRGFSLLTLKPLLVLANVEETAAAEPPPAELAAHAAPRGVTTVACCGQLEAEIAGLEADEQAAFLADYGIPQPARDQVLRACYGTLDLITFLTGEQGGREVRAWPVPRGTTAVEAAGTIHTDFARGFIRAETVAYTELDRLGSFAACRDAGVYRLEGRDYVVQDGDVITFRFNV